MNSDPRPDCAVDPAARPDASRLPGRIADSRIRSLLLCLVFCVICMSFGFILALPVIVLVNSSAPSTGELFVPNPIDNPITAFPIWFAALYTPVLAWTWFKGGAVVLRRVQARLPYYQEEKRVSHVAEEMAIAAHVSVPYVLIIDDQRPNAMMAASNPQRATIAVTSGLVARLNRQQLQAVVAHEIAHIVNGDVRFQTFLSANSSYWGGFADWLKHGLIVEKVIWLLPLWPAALVAKWLSRISGLAASRRREFLADDTAVMLTRDPRALVDALRALAAGGGEGASPSGLANLFIVDPEDPWNQGSTWLRSHPPLQERIRRLEELVRPTV